MLDAHMNWFGASSATPSQAVSIWDLSALDWVLAVVAAALIVSSLGVIGTAVAKSFVGLWKLLCFLYLTYTTIWRISTTILSIAALSLVVYILVLAFAEEETRRNITAVTSALSPMSNHVYNQVKDRIVVYNNYGQEYWRAMRQ